MSVSRRRAPRGCELLKFGGSRCVTLCLCHTFDTLGYHVAVPVLMRLSYGVIEWIGEGLRKLQRSNMGVC